MRILDHLHDDPDPDPRRDRDAPRPLIGRRPRLPELSDRETADPVPIWSPNWTGFCNPVLGRLYLLRCDSGSEFALGDRPILYGDHSSLSDVKPSARSMAGKQRRNARSDGTQEHAMRDETSTIDHSMGLTMPSAPRQYEPARTR